MRQFTETLRTLRMSLIYIAKVLKQAVTEIWVMGRVAGKPKVVAVQQQRRRACADAQLVSDFVVQSLESIIDKLVTSIISAF